MENELFDELIASAKEMDKIVKGKAKPARLTKVDAESFKVFRAAANLSQHDLAAYMQVPVATLRNWEQGRREIPGPAKALMHAIAKDPKHVLKALTAA